LICSDLKGHSVSDAKILKYIKTEQTFPKSYEQQTGRGEDKTVTGDDRGDRKCLIRVTKGWDSNCIYYFRHGRVN